MKKKVGVILAGCGYLDGAEIRESVFTLLALDKNDAEAVIMAPNIEQHHTVNHLTGEEVNHSRNVLEESARIARGQIHDITKVNIDELDALVLPGGFGAAKNLSSLAFKGAEGKMNSDVQKVIEKIHKANKPIGAICISPAVLCLALGKEAPEVTIGNDIGTAQAIAIMGGKHINCEVDEIHVDKKLKIITTPAYMYDDAPISKVAVRIEKCVTEVMNFLK